MNALMLLTTVIVCTSWVAHGGLLEFGIMIYRVTQRNPLISYVAYGCHCGHNGRGAPKDEVDWCCHAHDCCFGRMNELGCRPKTQPYTYTYIDGNLTCTDPENEKPDAACARQICECDKEAALCFKKNDGKYQRKYTFYINLFCRGPKPQC
ncbi:phospholipase A2, membrane associated-like [Microcaecilia unicolor]|uniref:Phospholipase A2 n=1 Tax=Microcaecilia unicolor TaxID=1415580 RepID=A0A6P7WN47_9AMPH|nr:phospholipase A2, membrane associated-like [Microcaecilia unicolor]XP_030041753.1 phospholipase A2, membrane associated-like [Microcaecilia unicolor]